MKKISLLFLSIALILGASCKKKGTPEPNTTPPSIALNGASSITLSVGDTYTELGATAKDVNNNNLNVVIDASAVNTTTTGAYQVKYSATDADGNFAQTTRTVNVAISSQNWVGSWVVAHNVRACTPTTNLISTSCSVSEFGGNYELLHGSTALNATVNGSTITVSSTPLSINGGVCTYNLTGSGTINSTGDEIVINYQWQGVCGLCGNGNATATYVKQ